ncbi:MAG: HAD family hydrolase [Proteobacteria bacterium]|nr:HAD family hydrolase [Pseudomonadota bacterium]
MPQAIIFDIDGTLVDSVDLHAESWARSFRHFGFSIPVADIRFQIGKGGDQLLPHLLGQEVADAQGPAIAEYRADLFEREFRSRVQPFPRVADLFAHIRKRGQRIALASSGKAKDAAVYKKLLGIEGLVDVETTSDDADKSKPHPDIFVAALERLNLPPDQVVVVGDTHYDVEAARKAGMGTVGLLCGGFPEEVLREAGCVAIYRDPAALLTGYAASPLAQ